MSHDVSHHVTCWKMTVLRISTPKHLQLMLQWRPRQQGAGQFAKTAQTASVKSCSGLDSGLLVPFAAVPGAPRS